jgi:hypothetical protein
MVRADASFAVPIGRDDQFELDQAALVDNDNSFTNSALLILSMLGLDVFFSCVKQRVPAVER